MPPTLNPALRFGSQLFANPEDTMETLRPAMEEIARAGFTLIRLFAPWGYLEKSPGIYSWEIFDGIFDEAQRQGIAIVMTLMAVSPPGWMHRTNGIQESADLDDEAFFAQALEHVRAVVTHYRNHPALDSWILWNEPNRTIDPNSPHAARAYREFLRERFAGEVEAYNASHYQPITRFEEAKVPGRHEGFTSYQPRVEWLNFSTENLLHKLKGLAAAVRELDPAHPIHVNPHRIGEHLANDGQSIWQEAKVVDFLGCSAHPAWHSLRFPRERYADSVAMFSDLMRSATLAPERYFWVTELQGGTTLMSAMEYLAASEREASLWLMQGVAAGAKAVIYWCTHGRTSGFEAGEWDLLDLRGQPTPQLEAITRTIRDLALKQAAFREAKMPRPDVGIVISEDSLTLGLAEGGEAGPTNPRNAQKGSDAAAGAYLLAADLSLETYFYDLERLQATPVEELPPLLLLPNLTVVDAATITFLERAAEAGCCIVADGFFAWKDAQGALAREQWDAADRLFGAACTGYEMIPDGAQIPGIHQNLPAWFFRGLLKTAEGTEAVASWADGRAAVTRRGSVWRIGTIVFQRYLNEGNAEIREWFRALLRDVTLPTAPRLAEIGRGVRLRRLSLEKSTLGILLNSSNEDRVVTVLDAEGCVLEEVCVPAMSSLVCEYFH